MGVKDLWSVLSPIAEKKSLWELRGQTIAIDLSAWVCDSQFANKHQNNMYLRNLFFRTAYLISIGVKPIFVLEGTAPQLKSATLARRLVARGGKGASNSRSRLTSLQKQCSELLSILGLEPVQAPSEAEAFCSHLNQLGEVSAVVSQDSDAFLYGAKTVLRNVSLGPPAVCDVYHAEEAMRRLALSRDRLVAFALLTGSDYSPGVHGIGRESAAAFLRSLSPEVDVFERFQLWKSSSYFPPSMNKYSPGSTCEMSIRARAIQTEDFPNMDVANEFMREPEPSNFDYSWSYPDIDKFTSWAVRKLGWEENYAISKILPLATRWHLIVKAGDPNGMLGLNGASDCSGLVVESILKQRTVRGVRGYEVSWLSRSASTVEDADLIEAAYPDLVKNFEESKKKPSRGGAKRKYKKTEGKEDKCADTLKSPAAKIQSLGYPVRNDGLRKTVLRQALLDSTNYPSNNVDLDHTIEAIQNLSFHEENCDTSLNSVNNLSVAYSESEFDLSTIVRDIVNSDNS